MAAAENPLSCSVVIVAYNSGDFIPVCLNSVLEALRGIDAEVIVLDNGSPEPLTEESKKAFPSVIWLSSQKNLGFGKGCNFAARRAQGRVLFFLNPDTVVAPDTFRKMLAYIQSKPDAGIVGCKILNGDGSLQWACRRTFPSPLAAVFKTIGLAALFPKSRTFAAYNMTFLDPDEETSVDAVSGSFFGVNRNVYAQVNGFDEDYFMYGEDLDICYRIQKLGLRNYYFPGTSILHFKGQSSRTRRVRTFIEFYQAMLIFARKHHNYHLPTVIIALGIFFAALVGVFSRLLPQWWKMGVDIAVTTAVYALASLCLPIPFSLNVAALAALGSWLPLAVFGEYSSPDLNSAQRISWLIPFESVVCIYFICKMGITPFCFIPAGLALVGLVCWRRVAFWAYYFSRIFFKKRRRAILLGGTSDDLSFWFDRYNVLPDIEFLGCVSGTPAEVTDENREHLLGPLEDIQSICHRTDCRDLMVLSDARGFHESFDLEKLKMLRIKTLLLVSRKKQTDFAVVDLNYLR